MIGAQAKAEQYFSRAGSEATKGSRKGFSLLGGGVNPVAVLSEADKRHNRKLSLVARMQVLQKEMAEAKSIVVHERKRKGKEFHAALERRATLAAELTAIIQELSALKTEAKPKASPTSVERHFMDICKDNLPSGQFRALLNAAIAAADAQSKPAND